MKRDFFYILFGMMLMTSTTLFAETTGTEIPLREIKSVGMFMPTDSPEQSSDDPPRPNQFHAYIAGQTLSFRIANTNLNHVIVHNPSGVVMLDVRFVGDTAFVLPTLGQHIVEIQNAGLHLIGDFNLDPNRQVRSGEPENPENPENPNEPPMTLSYTIDFDNINNCYIIEVEYPCFEVSEVYLPDETVLTAQVFNNIVYPTSNNLYDPFTYSLKNGQPKMPFLSLNLQIPEGATIDTSTEVIDYYNDIELNYPYAPVQNVPQTNEEYSIQYDGDYYDGHIYNEWAQPVSISGPYITRGTTGINVQLKPALYFPLNNIIRPIVRIRYIICISGNQSLLDMYEETIDAVNLGDLVNFYDTYITIDTVVHPEYKGNFLILTTEDYEDEAEDYADHKNNLGFNAWVETLDQNMLDPAFIRHYIKSWYDYEECSPQYILIIGNEIPYSAGALDNEYHPLTDIYYACVDEYDIADETDITPDIYVGRWPINNAEELNHIMQKSIYYDWHIPNRRMLLFSGILSMADDFAADNKYVYDIVCNEVSGMSAVNYDGRSGFNDSQMRFEFENNDNLFFIYQGHGAPDSLCAPYGNITKENLPHHLPYFNIGYACKLNYPNGLGWAWMNEGERSCTFYSSAVLTYRNYNKELERMTFAQLADNKNRTIGSLLYDGLNKRFASGASLRNAESYIFFGDPSLYIYGIELYVNSMQSASGKAEDLNNIELSEDIASYALYTISGVLVYSHSGNTDNIMADIEAQNLPDGIYILSAQTKDNNIPSQKIIIQH